MKRIEYEKITKASLANPDAFEIIEKEREIDSVMVEIAFARYGEPATTVIPMSIKQFREFVEIYKGTSINARVDDRPNTIATSPNSYFVCGMNLDNILYYKVVDWDFVGIGDEEDKD